MLEYRQTSEAGILDTYHVSITELEAGLEHIRQSPQDNGKVDMIVQRPNHNERMIVEVAELTPEQGLIGDNWKIRGSKHTMDGSANANMQITIMNSRVINLLAQAQERWSLAGDQLYIDIDLSNHNLPQGKRLALGTAVLEVSIEPHTGCKKFAIRYGTDATKFVNSKEGKRLRLRGINAKVVRAGTVRVGDVVSKI